MWLPKIM